MLTAALDNDEIRIIESNSDKVMLAEGLSKSKGISPAAMKRGLECATRFAQRIENIPQENIRIVGTNTLRAAKNAESYIKELEKIFSRTPIDIISGVEEARLIYLGVNHSWSSINKDTRNLVADIGGGSTEFIIGKNFKLKQADSLRMGCVAYGRFFPEQKISEKNFNKAVKSAKLELSNIKKDFSKKHWEYAIGSAGTFKAIERLLIEQELSEEGISFEGLKELKKRIFAFENFDTLSMKGLKPLREKTIVPGLAITWAIFETLKIDHMHISRGGLREGVLYDLIGRLKAEDIRERSIRALRRRYHVPEARSELFQKISRKLLKNLTLKNIELNQAHLLYLDWAAQACRVGLAISHSQYQNHSEYLIRHSELSGFTIRERIILSVLVKSHRRKFNLETIDALGFDEEKRNCFLVLVFLLRLTGIIGQNGKTNNCEHIRLKASPDLFEIQLDKPWANKHSMIRKAISQEKTYWEKAGFPLRQSYWAE